MTSARKGVLGLLRHPLFITVITFIFTGVLASNYQNYLLDRTKKQELETLKRQKASESVKIVTDLLYDRVFKGSMVVSSLKRHAPVDELKERKKIYDEVYIKYNSNIQSNMFRIREMFGTVYYTVFESLMENELRGMLLAQDTCITHAYDDAISNDDTKMKLTIEDIEHCKANGDTIELEISELYKGLVHCEYEFTNALFTGVEDTKIDGNRGEELVNNARTACTVKNYVHTASANAPPPPSARSPSSANVRPAAFVTASNPGPYSALADALPEPKESLKNEAQDDPEDHLHPYFPFAIGPPEQIGHPNVRKPRGPVERLDRHALGD